MRLSNGDPKGFILPSEPYSGRCVWLWEQKKKWLKRYFSPGIDVADDRVLLSISGGLGARIA